MFGLITTVVVIVGVAVGVQRIAASVAESRFRRRAQQRWETLRDSEHVRKSLRRGSTVFAGGPGPLISYRHTGVSVLAECTETRRLTQVAIDGAAGAVRP